MVHELLAAVVERKAVFLNGKLGILPGGFVGLGPTGLLPLDGHGNPIFNHTGCLGVWTGMGVNECRLIGSWNGTNNVNAV